MTIGGAEDAVDADGDTYMSDESSFYGDEAQRASLEACALAFDPQEYWSKRARSLTAPVITHQNPPSLPSRPYNPHAGLAHARQLSESVPDFLSRLPPLTTPTSQHGPWISIANPHHPPHPLASNLSGFAAAASPLLTTLRHAITQTEAERAARPHSLLARQLTALRRTTTERILAAATRHGVTVGKWMLFPAAADVNGVWGTVARVTARGQLGCDAKVAAAGAGAGAGGGARLICVYTRDFADMEDVRRVAKGLDDLGLIPRERSVYYKPDAFTHLDIGSGNPWGLRPSLYSSRDVLGHG